MGGISKPERATWRIANLTTRDLNGRDPALQVSPATKDARQGHKGLAQGVQGDRVPLGAAKQPSAERSGAVPLLVEKRISE
jgi:hypothetical protein